LLLGSCRPSTTQGEIALGFAPKQTILPHAQGDQIKHKVHDKARFYHMPKRIASTMCFRNDASARIGIWTPRTLDHREIFSSLRRFPSNPTLWKVVSFPSMMDG
jgi:hypothetical protein